MARFPSDVLRCYVRGARWAGALPNLTATYCGTIAYEVEHIASHEERVWLRRVIESGEHRKPLSAADKRGLLSRLTLVDTLERFLQRAYLGQKRFSIEGVDVTVPMLDTTLELAAAFGARKVVMGMAHRGRLNVLAHVVSLPYEAILEEFEGGGAGSASDPEAVTGDVKYHLGAEGTYKTTKGQEVTVSLLSNPSHLEAVNPVVEGWTRAAQTDRSGPEPKTDGSALVPLLIHGTITQTPPVREKYAAQLAAEGLVTAEAAKAEADAAYATLTEVQQALKARRSRTSGEERRIVRAAVAEPETAVAADVLTRVNEQLLVVPAGFTVHPKLKRQLERRRETMTQGGMERGQAEALAFASLLVEGSPILFTGQDLERGTFSQRPLVLHGPANERRWAPIQHGAGAP